MEESAFGLISSVVAREALGTLGTIYGGSSHAVAKLGMRIRHGGHWGERWIWWCYSAFDMQCT